jgi:hypothetical protein
MQPSSGGFPPLYSLLHESCCFCNANLHCNLQLSGPSRWTNNGINDLFSGYCHVISVTVDAVWPGKRVHWALALVTTSNYCSPTEIYSPKITVAKGHTKSSVFIGRCPVAAIIPLPLDSWNARGLSYQLLTFSTATINSKFEVMLRPKVSRPISLGAKPDFGSKTRCLLLSDSWVCRCGAPTVTRGRVFPLQLLLAHASAVILGLSPAGLLIIFRCLRFVTPPAWRTGPRIYTPWNRMAQLYPGALGSRFIASYDSQGYNEGIRTCLEGRGWFCDRHSVGQFVFLSGTPSGPVTRF